MTFRKAFFTVSGLTMLSRVTGFLRDVMAANILGAGMAADAFFVALRLPNLFRRLFAEGAFSISFVPLFTGELKEGRAEARAFAEQALAGLLLVLVPFTVVMIAVMPWFMHVITPGYADNAEKFALAVRLSEITFPYLMLISLAALLGSMLNAVGRFGPYAMAPIAFNLTQLVALFIWRSNELEAAVAQAWAVTVSGAIQLIWLVVSARRAGWNLRLIRPQMTPKMRRLLQLIGPGALGAGVIQVNIFIDMVLASLLPAGAVSYLSYAERLYQLPIGVIGIAVGTALLPILSNTLRTAPPEKAHDEQNRALEFALYLALPAAVALVVIPVPILTVLFQRGAFDATVTYYTAWAGATYALAIPAYTINKVLTVAYYAREDTRSPFLVSMQTVGLNTGISLLLILSLRHSAYADIAHAGLAFATSSTAWINSWLLARGLRRRGHFVPDADFRARLTGTALSGLGMAVVLWLSARGLEPWFHAALPLKIVALALVASAGTVTYFALAHATGAQRLDEVKNLLRRRAPKGTDAPSVPTE